VYDSLLAAGASDVDLRRKLPGPSEPADVELQYLAVRRPLLEWALRRAIAGEARIRVLAPAQATGISIIGGRVRGIRVHDSDHEVDLVVDALGRRTPTPRWIEERAGARTRIDVTDCSVIYYSRYYRLLDGFDLPDGPWVLSPRGDLGYLAFATFPGDNRTFASVLATPTGSPEWRRLRTPAAYEAAIAQIPMLRLWVDPAGVRPITDVLPMAGLHNSLRHHDTSTPVGVVAVGDSICHTDPVLAHGLAFALIHAAALVTAVAEHDDVESVCAAYISMITPAAAERFAFSSALDEQRHRMWHGEHVDFAHRDGDFALFSMFAAGAAALVDADVFRMFVRRIGLLDSTSRFDDDDRMQIRVEQLFQQSIATSRPAPGPARHDMLAVLSDAG
jgi:2-polyprenyl-6-methoxyphenol hydroxylase-like FAD-dependent oxidoreductase